MVAKKKKAKKKIKKKRSFNPRDGLFLKAYLSRDSKGFLNSTESAIIAQYNCTTRESFAQLGDRLKRKFKDKILEWIEAEGISEGHIKLMVTALMEGRETVFQKVKGQINEEELPEGVKVISRGDEITHKTGIDGKLKTIFGETLIAIPVRNLMAQIKAVDMAIKLKGLYAAEKKNISGSLEIRNIEVSFVKPGAKKKGEK